jgi:hypothetical protein
MARLEGDIEQMVTGADGKSYSVGSPEMLTDAQKAEIGSGISLPSDINMGEEAIPAEQNMGLESMSDMPMMSEEEKRVFTELFERGVPEDMIIDIMASAKVGATIPATAVNPAEFGGLPKTGSSPAGNPSMQTSPATGNPTGMSQNDMAMYLQNKVNEIKGRTGGSAGMGALSGVPAGNQTPMAMPKPRPAVMPQRLGADRTFNPMDQLTPTNAPNT